MPRFIFIRIQETESHRGKIICQRFKSSRLAPESVVLTCPCATEDSLSEPSLPAPAGCLPPFKMCSIHFRVNCTHFQEFNCLHIDDTKIRTPISTLLDSCICLPMFPSESSTGASNREVGGQIPWVNGGLQARWSSKGLRA